MPHGQLFPQHLGPTERYVGRTSGPTATLPSQCAMSGRRRLTVRQPMRLCSKGRWKARGSPHQSSSSVAALWKLAGFCKCCGGKREKLEAARRDQGTEDRRSSQEGDRWQGQKAGGVLQFSQTPSMQSLAHGSRMRSANPFQG